MLFRLVFDSECKFMKSFQLIKGLYLIHDIYCKIDANICLVSIIFIPLL